MEYYSEKHELICPAGKRLTYQYSPLPKTDNGYQGSGAVMKLNTALAAP